MARFTLPRYETTDYRKQDGLDEASMDYNLVIGIEVKADIGFHSVPPPHRAPPPTRPFD